MSSRVLTGEMDMIEKVGMKRPKRKRDTNPRIPQTVDTRLKITDPTLATYIHTEAKVNFRTIHQQLSYMLWRAREKTTT